MCQLSYFSLKILLFVFLLSLPTISNAHPMKPHNPNNTSHSTTTNTDPFELETLFKIMESMSSDRNWRTSYPNPCKPGSSWVGLECRISDQGSRFHVFKLQFGSPPNPSCKKTATFPSEIFILPYLQSAFFSHCFTHTKTIFTVNPTSTSSSSQLQQLSLRSNQALIGPIPPQISSLKSLQILTLSQNSLHGRIPVEIFTLTSLNHLDLSYNFLMGTIPNNVGNLKNLVGLDLSYNSLSGSIPSTIGQLGLLQKLDLSSNFLSGSVPNSIQKLNFLFFLALSKNRIRGGFPKGLEKLQNLQYFYMDNNPMFLPLPFELGNLLRLQELSLANSGYSGSIPESFSHLFNLSTLSLQNNRLTGEIPVGLSNLSHIYELNLSRNMLRGIVPFNSGFLKRLGRNLDLSGNPDLCLNRSSVLDGVKIGVSVCGNNSGSVILPLKRSDAASSVSNFFKFFSFLGIFLCFGIL